MLFLPRPQLTDGEMTTSFKYPSSLAGENSSKPPKPSLIHIAA